VKVVQNRIRPVYGHLDSIRNFTTEYALTLGIRTVDIGVQQKLEKVEKEKISILKGGIGDIANPDAILSQQRQYKELRTKLPFNPLSFLKAVQNYFKYQLIKKESRSLI
jgi:hypothetical protein